jgi:hypothetical protein
MNNLNTFAYALISPKKRDDLNLLMRITFRITDTANEQARTASRTMSFQMRIQYGSDLRHVPEGIPEEIPEIPGKIVPTAYLFRSFHEVIAMI